MHRSARILGGGNEQIGRFPFRGSRSPVVSVAAILLSIKIAPGLFVTAAAGEALSASAERYATCVEQEATGSARARVRDPEVLGSAVPEKALSVLVDSDVVKICGPLVSKALSSEGVDGVIAMERGYDATKAAISSALTESPPPPHPPASGSDDYVHGEKLENGAWEYLSIECKALLDRNKYAAPASCNEEVRRANRLYKEESDRKSAQLLENPTVRYCLGLRSLEEVESGPSQNAKGNLFDALAEEAEEDNRKLQATLKSPFENAYS